MSNVIDRIFAFLGALCFAQLPQVFFQYQHELAGHVAELKVQVGLIEHAAFLSNKNLAEWIAKFQQSQDPDFALQGNLLKGMVDRLANLSEALLALQTSTPAFKPFLFVRYLDKQILYNTLESFQFGFNFTMETFVYALFGLFAAHLLFKLIRSLFSKTKQIRFS